MMQSVGIVVNGVTVTWRNGHTALRDASFIVPGGSIAALVGVDGSGKSTLFKAIMGFVRLASGKISVLGIPTRQTLQKNLVAYVPQSEDVGRLFPVPVEDVVMVSRYRHMGMLRIIKRRSRQVVTGTLERVDIVNFRHRQIGKLSDRQEKRVFLARAIAQRGDVILLGEPFTDVDVKTEAKIISLLRELHAGGKTTLVSTYNPGSVATFCDYAVMVKGTVLANEPTDTIFTAENLELAFSGILRHVTLNGSEESIITDDERPLVARRPSAVQREER